MLSSKLSVTLLCVMGLALALVLPIPCTKLATGLRQCSQHSSSTGTVAVTLWVDEKANYNYDANTSAPNKYDKNPDKINPKLEQHTT
ncbi:hypothetical protein Patl1_35563 [Pistacia atlantica]|nr:hypothetical protein Patl1_35563 [Pistacia atlantica]